MHLTDEIGQQRVADVAGGVAAGSTAEVVLVGCSCVGAWPEAGIATAASAAIAHFQLFMPTPLSVAIAERQTDRPRPDHGCWYIMIDITEEADVRDAS